MRKQDELGFSTLYDGEIISIPPGGGFLLLACCECGLIHRMDFKKKCEFQISRQDEMTEKYRKVVLNGKKKHNP